MPRLLLVLLAAGALAACQTVQTTQPGVVGVQRSQQMLISSAEVNASAEKAYQQQVGTAAKKGQVNQNQAQVERVRRIAQRLIPQTSAFRSDAPAWKWETNVITAKEVNAYQRLAVVDRDACRVNTQVHQGNSAVSFLRQHR